MLLKLLKRRSDGIIYLWIMLGLYLAGIVLAGIIGMVMDDEVIPNLGTLFAMLGILFMHMLVEIVNFAQEFNMGISMGQIRKKFVWCYELVSLLQLVAAAVILWLMNMLEFAIYPLINPNAILAIEMHHIFQLRYIVPVILAMVVVEMLNQALLLRFGTKIFWVLWFVWMVVCILPANLVQNAKVLEILEKITVPILELIRGTNGMIITAIVVGAGAAVAGVAWNMLRKQQVTL